MYKSFFKRVIDIVLSLAALPFLLLILILVAPIIFCTDKGPVFYNANRMGKNGKAYKMYKFRSMYVNSPDLRNKDGSTYNGAEDTRVTPIGRVLRKTSLDEVPQVFNVLFGTMSVVGPRPNLLPDSFDELPQIQKDRVKVRPGITGYSQAYFRNSISPEQKFINDVYYTNNISFLFDLKIMRKTISSVLHKENIYIKQENKITEKASHEPEVK